MSWPFDNQPTMSDMFWGQLSPGKWGFSSDQTAFLPGTIQAAMVGGQKYGDAPWDMLDKQQMMGGQNGLFGGMGLKDMLGLGLSAFNMFRQWGMQDDYLDMAREQLGIAKEQWAKTKEEMERIRRVRNNMTSGYQHGNYYSGNAGSQNTGTTQGGLAQTAAARYS